MRREPRAAEVFPPGEFIRDELEARGWSQADLAEILGRPVQAVNEILTGRKQITPETAVGLAQAFGTSPDLWLGLEAEYRLSRVSESGDAVPKRARLYCLYPVRELIRLGWVPDSEDPDALASHICALLSIRKIGNPPPIRFVARARQSAKENRTAQALWVCRARALAVGMKTGPYSAQALRAGAESLPGLSRKARRVTELPAVLARLGVCLVFVPNLRGARIDGAALQRDDGSPVVALSVRYDRIDYLWFTLMHELAHIVLGHCAGRNILDLDLVGRMASGKPAGRPSPQEREADRAASDWLIPRARLQAFVNQTRPYFAEDQIRRFAAELGIHPGLVVGRLQHDGHLPWSHLRNLLEGIQPILREHGLLDALPGKPRKHAG